MKPPRILFAVLVGVAAMVIVLPAAAQVQPHQAEKIRAAAPEKARVAPQKPRTVLIWNTPPSLMTKDPHRGYCIPFGECAMKTLGEKTGAFTPVVSDDLAMFLPDKIRRFDAIVMNNSSGQWIRPAEADMGKMKAYGADQDAVEKVFRQSLLDWVSRGGGIVAYHFATGANPKWPEFRELLGVTFTGHPWNEEVGIRNEEPGHPLLAAFGGKNFRIADEIYQFGDPYSRKKLRVLLSIDTKTTNMNVKWLGRKDSDFAQAWVKPYGKGRVFCCGIGHRTEIYWNPLVLQFYLDAIQFATGDLSAPMEPR